MPGAYDCVGGSRRLQDVAPEIERALAFDAGAAARFDAGSIRRETVWVTTRGNIRLATDVYLPPDCPGPVIAVRTPYGRRNPKVVEPLMALAQHGYISVAQDCRGTGDSEPDSWDYYIYEHEDGFDFVEWMSQQSWFDGFLGACGSSYLAQTQWCMAGHPRMSTIVPEVSGLGIAIRTVHLYMFLNAYVRSVGKGADKLTVGYDELERQMVQETLAGGYFNEPLQQAFSDALLVRYPQLRALPPSEGKRWLWEHYTSLSPLQRAQLINQAVGGVNVTMTAVESLGRVFGQHISHDAHTIPHAQPPVLMQTLHAPALMITGWYDWGLDDTLATWNLLTQSASAHVRSKSRLLITPSAHNVSGYHEGLEGHPELKRNYRLPSNVALLLRWYAAVRGDTLGAWPRVIYYLMGANQWHTASAWPPPEIRTLTLHLGADELLTWDPPGKTSPPDCYTYDPQSPTPTVGGSILSYVYPPGSIDVSEVQKRSDVLTYTTAPLKRSLDVVGPLRLILYASSSAVDTDFAARLSDVFPDGRAIQLQSGILRARYRDPTGDPQLLEPGRIYRFEIDMWATANRFARGHRLRLDISSTDFPRFDRNANLGGAPGPPVEARQTIFRDAAHPSRLLLPIVGPVS
jgi:predicted acyl esterase